MKERFKIYFGVAGAHARKVALKRVRLDLIGIVLVASLGVGAVMGYLQASGFDVFFEASNQLQKAVNLLAAAETPEPVQSKPVLPPAWRAPQTQPVVEPGPAVSEPQSPSVAARSPGGSLASASTPAFQVQVGAFRLRENAEALVMQLNRDGFRASMHKTGDLFKVQLGPFNDRKEASRLAKELKAKRYDVFVTRGKDSE